jgi:AcrR family transcriptional regulator
MARKAASPAPAGKSTARAPKRAAAKPPAPRKRAPGRPNVDSPDQRTRLLDAALACYVRKGIEATSLRDIAAEAGVTPALVHYYFGDAQQLRDSVIEERLLPVFQGVREPLSRIDADDLAALVAGFVSGVFRAVEAHPWWPALWVREVLSEGGALRDLLVTRVAPEFARMVAQRFAQAQARGQLNADLDPRLLLVTLIGLTLFPAAGAPIWRQLFQVEDLGMDDVRLHALALLDRGLELKA